MSKQVKADIILQFLNKPLDLYHLFQRTYKEKKDLLQVYQKSHFESYFFTNFGKLGLTTFLGEIYFHPSIKSQKNLIVDLFGSLPFITPIYFQNRKIRLYAMLPQDAKPIFCDYLKKMQHVQIISHFQILQLKKYESTISLNRSQNKHAYISSFLPFTGRYWFQFNRPLKKIHDLIDKHYSQQINYTPSKPEFLITPLHLLLLLSKREIFQNLYFFSNMRNFLSNTKKIISLKVKVREIPPKIQNIQNFSETFAYFIECGFFNQHDDFSSAKKALETVQAPPEFVQNSSLRSVAVIPSKFLKSGKKMIDCADLCKYSSPASLENYSSDELFNEINHILSELRNRHQYSQYMLEKKINQLFSSKILLENRGNQITQFFDEDPRFFMVQIRTKNRLDWLERILFVNFLSHFESVEENVYNYQILLSADYWRVFIRFLTLTPLDWIEFLPVQVIPTPAQDLLFFYNYSDQKWDLMKFSLSKNCTQIASLAKKYLPSIARAIPFYPVHDEKSADLFPPFSLRKFMQGVFIIRKDNEITKKLLKSPSPYFAFLNHTFLTPSFDVDRAKIFLRENYSFEFAQIQRVLAIMPKQRPAPQSDLGMGRYLLIIKSYFFPCHPRVLLHDRMLKGLFCPGLQHAFFFGGVKEGVLVLEYIFPKFLVHSPGFNLQHLLNRIEQKYLYQLRLLRITDEYRFVSPEYSPSASLEIKQFQHLLLRKADKQIAHPAFVHILQDVSHLNASREIPDAFWQVVGHPVTLFAHITCSASMKIPIVNMLMQFPIGQILVSEGDSKCFNNELTVWIHLAETIEYAFYQLIQLLEKEDIHYFVSPIIDYSIINDPNLNLPIDLP